MTSYTLVKCKKCGKSKTVVEHDKIKMPQTFHRKIEEKCECDD